MNEAGTKRTTRPAGSLRMKDLSEATGLPKSAILHYIAQGLLPEPVRTGTNMAYYDPGCIERVRFIKDMQSRYAFPLHKIKTLLAKKDAGIDLAPLIELNETVFVREEAPPLGREAFCAATGLTQAQVRALTVCGLLLPLERGHFDGQDVAIGKIFAQGLALGIKPSDLAFYSETARQIVDGEMLLRRRLTDHLPEDQDAGLTQQMVRAARATRSYVIDRTFQQRIAGAGHLKDENLLTPEGRKRND